MIDLDKLKSELDTKAELKYIKLHRKNQLYYYTYKNLDIVLRYHIPTDTIEYVSISRKANRCNLNQD